MKKIISIIIVISILMGLGLSGCTEIRSGIEEVIQPIKENTYKTPLDLYASYINIMMHGENHTLQDKISLLNGFAEEDVSTFYSMMWYTEKYQKNHVMITNEQREAVKQYKEQYGPNFKVSYEVTEKKDFDTVMLKNMVDSTFDWDFALKKDDTDEQRKTWYYFCDFTWEEWQEIVAANERVVETVKNSKITRAYQLQVTWNIISNLQETPVVMGEETVIVFEIDGRWVSTMNWRLTMDEIEGLYSPSVGDMELMGK